MQHSSCWRGDRGTNYNILGDKIQLPDIITGVFNIRLTVSN